VAQGALTNERTGTFSKQIGEILSDPHANIYLGGGSTKVAVRSLDNTGESPVNTASGH
jgi:hypothetical protein